MGESCATVLQTDRRQTDGRLTQSEHNVVTFA